MFRPLVIAGCICLFAESAVAQRVQIEISEKAAADESGTTAATEAVSTETSRGEATVLSIPEGYNAKLEYGHGQYLKGDYQSALTVYRAAKDSKTTDPLPLYFIACTQAKLQQFDDAMITLSALKTVCGDKLPSLSARGLFLTAIIEETRGNLEDAKAAWTAYKQFAAAHSDIQTLVGSADERLQALEKKTTLDTQYEAVRARIASGTD